MVKSLKSSGKTVLIGILCSSGSFPDYFSLDLNQLIDYTRSKGYKIRVQVFKNSNLCVMKNQACLASLGIKFSPDGSKCDFLYILETDHRYSPDSLVKLIESDKEVVFGSTTTRIPLYNPTQYKKLLIVGMKETENLVYPIDESLIECEGSGSAGILIKTSVLDKMKWPFFQVEFYGDYQYRTSDLYFFHRLKELGIKAYLHSGVIYPHQCKSLFSSVNGLQYLE